MSNLVIPKGKNYEFTIKVIEKDSFLAQDLTTLVSAVFDLLERDTMVKISSIDMVVTDAVNGLLKGTISDIVTGDLVVNRGGKEDGYYLKAGYQGVIELVFSDIPSINVLLPDIMVSPSGV